MRCKGLLPRTVDVDGHASSGFACVLRGDLAFLDKRWKRRKSGRGEGGKKKKVGLKEEMKIEEMGEEEKRKGGRGARVTEEEMEEEENGVRREGRRTREGKRKKEEKGKEKTEDGKEKREDEWEREREEEEKR